MELANKDGMLQGYTKKNDTQRAYIHKNQGSKRYVNMFLAGVKAIEREYEGEASVKGAV